MANEIVYEPDDMYNDLYGSFISITVGNDSGTGVGNAIRFPSIAVAQGVSVDYADLRIHVGVRGTDTGNNLKVQIYGIDEDDTGSFDASVLGRTKTSAVTTSTTSPQSVGSYNTFDVRSQVNEILSRGGWVSGNDMGFMILDNASSNDCYIYDSIISGDDQSLLVIRVSAEPDFTPTPKSVAAPTFPASTNYGIKISQPGVSVKSATEAQLLFTTRKSITKVVLEGEVTTSGGQATIAHGLGYVPSVIGFVSQGGKRVELNRIILPAYDPLGSGVQGYISADSTNIIIHANSGSVVYYYAFIEEQA